MSKDTKLNLYATATHIKLIANEQHNQALIELMDLVFEKLNEGKESVAENILIGVNIYLAPVIKIN
jgi:hypothetical protein